jgi:phage gpG-like protein
VTDAVTLEIKGLDVLMAKLGQGATPVLRTLTRGIAEEVKGEIARYPGKVKRPIQWASDKQRRWWFATRRKAGLGPYVRNSDPWSQRIGPSWATAQRGETSAVVGTRVTYAPWVQRAGKLSRLDAAEGMGVQQPMHAATGWVTDAQAVRTVNESGVARDILAAILQGW